jgi:hypothetical protein
MYLHAIYQSLYLKAWKRVKGQQTTFPMLIFHMNPLRFLTVGLGDDGHSSLKFIKYHHVFWPSIPLYLQREKVSVGEMPSEFFIYESELILLARELVSFFYS